MSWEQGPQRSGSRPASDRPSWRSSRSARITGRNSEGRAPRSARSPSPWGSSRRVVPNLSGRNAPRAVARLAAAYRKVAGAAGILPAVLGADEAIAARCGCRRDKPTRVAAQWVAGSAGNSREESLMTVESRPRAEPATRKGRLTRDRIVAVAAELIYKRGEARGRHPGR